MTKHKITKSLVSYVLAFVMICGMLPMSVFAAETDNAITIDGTSMPAADLQTAVTDALNDGKRDFTITGNLTEEQQKAVGTALCDWCHYYYVGELNNPDGQGTVSIMLPDVTAIADRAFRPNEECVGNALKSIHLPEATIIGEFAFDGQHYLQSIIAPKVTEVKTKGLFDCGALTDVQMPNITTVGQSAFAWTGITTFPWNNLQYIGRASFSVTGISGVISLPKAVSIDIDAFMGCSNLTGVKAPQVKTIGSSAFSYCPNLTELTFGTAIESVGGQVLHNGNQPLYSQNITLTLAADQKVLSGGDNTILLSLWTVAEGAATVEFGTGKTFCGYTFKEIIGHEHSFDTEWKSDGTNHWHECSCGAKEDEAAHNGGAATCKDKAVCSVCGTAYGNLAEHTYGDATCEAPATCSECGATTGDALGHKDDNKDHTCDRGCGKTDMGNHADSATDTDHLCDYGCGATLENCTDAENDNNHSCDVCGKADASTHTYGNATCEAPATCSECGATTGDALGHKDDNTDHTCDRGCGKTNMGTHGDTDTDHACDYGCTEAIGTHAAATGKHICDYCSAAVSTCKDDDENHICDICGAELTHDYSTEWKSDGTNHWHECSCGEKADEAAHNGGTASCTDKAKCVVCAEEYGELAAHTYGTEWKSDGTNHWHECTCGAKADEAAHNGGTASCTDKAKCVVCAEEYGELAAHTYGTEWKSDGTNHWHECSCGAKADNAAHNGGTATCTVKAACTACGVAYGELAAHTYEKGKCTVCEAVDPDYIPESSSPQTGDNSHLALWIALLFISGGAVISLTVYDRKRRNTVKH